MTRIFKYEITSERLALALPQGATILTAAGQGHGVFIWAAVDPAAPPETRHFEMFATGEDMPPADRSYLGSAMLVGGALVFHVFERRAP